MFKLRHLLLLLPAALCLLAACVPAGSSGGAEVVEVTRTGEEAPLPTQTAESSAADSLITSLVAAGATVADHGRSRQQALFPVEGISLRHLTVNDEDVFVYEFSDAAAREAVSSRISPTGDTYTVTEGETTVTTTWDGEGWSRWWVLDNLLVGYRGLDTALPALLTGVLGPPIADGSEPYRPEAGSGAIAGIGEYGVSFQYDPYLAAGVQAHLVEATTGGSGAGNLPLPRHISFTFPNSYADADPFLARAGLVPEVMPQIVVYPAAAYSALSPLAAAQIEQLQSLPAERPIMPGGSLPYLPAGETAPLFHSQVTTLTFAGGAGVRYVTAFAPEAAPITREQLIYTFQGLTDDGQYYVAAFFPVTAALPDDAAAEGWEADGDGYAAYVAEIQAALDSLEAGGFTPDITLLDAVVSSLRVEPEVELGGTETPVEAGRFLY